MTDSCYSTSDSSSHSFLQINEEDADFNPPIAEPRVPQHEVHSTETEWIIKAESEFSKQLYAASRTATIGVLGPNQSGKTTLVNYLSKKGDPSTNASASSSVNRGLRRTVFTEAWRSYCKVSRNNASPSYATFFLDTPGHPQQLPDSISICSQLNTVILVVSMCAGLQFDHTMYMDALGERLVLARNCSYTWSPPTCILAFSNIDKFCYEEVNRLRKKSVYQCCLVQYVALRLRLQIEHIEAVLCRDHPWFRSSLSPQVLLCYYNCTKAYCLVSVLKSSQGITRSFAALETIVDSLLSGNGPIPETPILYIPKHIPNQAPLAINPRSLRSLFLCCCPYKFHRPWIAYIFYTQSALTGNEGQWRQLFGADALGPLIEESDGSLVRLSTILADTMFVVLLSAQHRDNSVAWIKHFNQDHFLPYITHIQLPSPLVLDALQLSTCISGLDLQVTRRPEVLEVRTRGEYTLNLFLSIFHFIAQKLLIQKVQKQAESVVKALPLLPILKKCISHASQKPTQLKVYLDEFRGIINFSISILLRESPPPQVWGYRIGPQKRSELLATLDPRVSVFDQVATLYANSTYSIIDGTMKYDTVSVGEETIVLSSQLSHSSTLIEALKEAIYKEAENSCVAFHNLQLIILDCKCYQKTHCIHLHANTLFTNAIENSRLSYIEPLLYAQVFITTGLYHTKKEQSFLSGALEKLKCLLCSRRCMFMTDPWIQMTCPISSLAVTSFYIPAGSALGLEMAIEHILRCTSVNIYHKEQVYFTQVASTILDPADLKGTVDAMKSRSSTFSKKDNRTQKNT